MFHQEIFHHQLRRIRGRKDRYSICEKCAFLQMRKVRALTGRRMRGPQIVLNVAERGKEGEKRVDRSGEKTQIGDGWILICSPE